MNNEKERRFFKSDKIEIRTNAAGVRQIVGYAAVFNQLSEDLGGFREKIDPGTFKKTIQEADIRSLFNHDPNFVIARNKSGTLELIEDRTGLLIVATPPDTSWARGLMVSIERGDIDQMSFGFRTIKDHWEEIEGQDTIRTLKEVKLFDTGPVTYPAYPQTSAAVRSLDDWRKKNCIDIEILKRKLDLKEKA